VLLYLHVAIVLCILLLLARSLFTDPGKCNSKRQRDHTLAGLEDTDSSWSVLTAGICVDIGYKS
jgi:hypothetical protein